MKKHTLLNAALILTAFLLAAPAQADSERSHRETGDAPDGTTVLRDSVLISGEGIYYSGVLAGGGGIYRMNNDGGEREMLSPVCASPEAVSDGNLLVRLNEDRETGVLQALRPDGTLETVARGCNGHAIARDGRFYFGGSSADETGADCQRLFSCDPVYDGYLWPLEVCGGYLYYLDHYGGESVVPEGMDLPIEATLNRLNLTTGETDRLSGVGTRYFGMDDGSIVYTRERFMVYDGEGGSFLAEVDEGLFLMNLTTLEEKRLSGPEEDDLIIERWRFLKDGVIYGDRMDYTSSSEGECSVIRMKTDGETLPSIRLKPGRSMEGKCVSDGKFYGVGLVGFETEDSYISRDVVEIVDLESGEITERVLEAGESMFLSAAGPQIAVQDGFVYYCTQNMESGAESLKVIEPDGEIRTLIQGEARIREGEM